METDVCKRLADGICNISRKGEKCMKKQSFLCVLLCIFLLLPLFSCGLGGGTGNPDTGQKPATRTESNDTKPIEPKPTEPEQTTGATEAPKPPVGMLTLFGDAVTCRILNCYSTVSAKDTVLDFMADVTEKTGCTLGYSSASADASMPEIVVGTAEARPESVAVYNGLRWSGRDIRIVGNKIYVNTRSEMYLASMLNLLLSAMTKTEKGWEIAMNFTYAKDAGTLDADLPMPETSGTDAGVMQSDDGNRYVATYKNVTEAEYTAYVAKLIAAGFQAYDESTVNGNRFGTYTKGNTQVNLCLYPARATFKVLYGKRGTLPSLTKPETEQLVKPSITQLARKAVDESSPNGAPGMGYVIQLSDGRYILVDGGPVDLKNEDPKALLDYLVANKPASHEKPIIAAWIISHAHGDHLALPTRFLRDFHDQVVVEMSITNFPYFKGFTMQHDNATALAGAVSAYQALMRAYYPKAGQVVAHTGQRFWIGDAYLEIFYTQDDGYPTIPGTANETSLVFRVTLGGKTCMFLGDLDSCAFMRDVWGTAVKSDILQLAHHGYNGGDLELYKNIDPEICFWAGDEWRFLHDKRCLGTQSGYEFNKWIRDDSVRVRRHLHNSVTAIIHLDGDNTTVETIGQ